MLQRDVMLLEQQRMSRCMRCAQPRAALAATESDVAGRHVELYDGRPVGGHRPRTGWCRLSAASAAVRIRMQRDTRFSMVTMRHRAAPTDSIVALHVWARPGCTPLQHDIADRTRNAHQQQRSTRLASSASRHWDTRRHHATTSHNTTRSTAAPIHALGRPHGQDGVVHHQPRCLSCTAHVLQCFT